jgi:hypothetical protein
LARVETDEAAEPDPMRRDHEAFDGGGLPPSKARRISEAVADRSVSSMKMGCTCLTVGLVRISARVGDGPDRALSARRRRRRPYAPARRRERLARASLSSPHGYRGMVSASAVSAREPFVD